MNKRTISPRAKWNADQRKAARLREKADETARAERIAKVARRLMRKHPELDLDDAARAGQAVLFGGASDVLSLRLRKGHKIETWRGWRKDMPRHLACLALDH